MKFLGVSGLDFDSSTLLEDEVTSFSINLPVLLIWVGLLASLTN